MKYTVQEGSIRFDSPLLRGVIRERPNRFIMWVELDDGSTVKAHCPVTGIIGGLKLSGLPCLLSEAAASVKRSTTHTVEAIAVQPYTSPDFQWIGINQNMVNRYVETFIREGQLKKIPQFREIQSIKREPKLGSSRLDFLINDHIYVEVKTPIKNLQIVIPSTVERVEPAATGTERMLRQVGDIVTAMKAGDKGLLLTVFMYDNPGFKIPKAHNSIYSETVKAMTAAKAAGLDQRQINLAIDERGVYLRKVF